jgi:hypothetical protein
MSGRIVQLSGLDHTWFIDVDGTIVPHNTYLRGEPDELLPGVREFWDSIPAGDAIVIVSARDEAFKGSTLAAIQKYGLRFDHAIFGLPFGERILVNDIKPNGLHTAHAVNVQRDVGLSDITIEVTEFGE